ncbi:glycosyl hydrolase family 8 [Mycolicibacterium hodleri]|uniref:glycosyl hydrolase family 8 n=1 Tax=Mycolicibacterium hodleri TaxID=49897 RepID=UPI0013754E57|nr:glycosyl hydrolase family 8 [Mycolicibacterium hodleri]
MWRSNWIGSHDAGQTRGQDDVAATSAARDFLNGYVEPDGRVVRRDEGGDVVSEGQAYGMLIAAAIGDESTFRRVWAWTKSNLSRSDGLLAWRWLDGAIADPNSASDADLDAVRALLLAGSRFSADDLTEDGRRMAAAVMSVETVELTPAEVVAMGSSNPPPPPDAQSRVLVGGNWATSNPWQINPSYFNPRAEQQLSQTDPRWGAMTATHRALLEQLSSQAPLLPDWAQIDDGSVKAVGHNDVPVQAGLDAARIAIRFSESCSPDDRRLAAALGAELNAPPMAVGIRHLDGSPAVEWKHPISLVAAAAADHAAGHDAGADEDLIAAMNLQRDYPSYYGAAWVALGYLMLRTSMLGSCDASPSAP